MLYSHVESGCKCVRNCFRGRCITNTYVVQSVEKARERVAIMYVADIWCMRMHVPFPVEEVNVECYSSIDHPSLQVDCLGLLGSVGEEGELCVPALGARQGLDLRDVVYFVDLSGNM